METKFRDFINEQMNDPISKENMKLLKSKTLSFRLLSTLENSPASLKNNFLKKLASLSLTSANLRTATLTLPFGRLNVSPMLWA